MKEPLSPQTAAAMAAQAGHRISSDDAARIAAAIGPALSVFADVEASLPFAAEPAHFATIQMQGRQQL